jgi:hypothetical protein
MLGVHHFFFGGGMLAVAESRLLRIDHDDSLHIAYRVNQLKEDPPEGTTVYVFGGSGAMEAIVGDRSFAGDLEEHARVSVSAVNLASHAQSLAQNLVIVDNLPPGEALLLIGLAPMRFNTPPGEDTKLLSSRSLLLRSPRLRELAPELYGKRVAWTGGLPGAADFISAYLKTRLRSGPLPGRRQPYARHYFGRDSIAVSPQAKRATLDSVWRYNLTHYAANHEYNLGLLEELVRFARERGFELAFFDQPLNTFAAGDWAGVLPRYRAEVERIASEYGVPYLHVERSLVLRDADFVDLYHLMPAARARWQKQMSREVAELLASPAESSLR